MHEPSACLTNTIAAGYSFLTAVDGPESAVHKDKTLIFDRELTPLNGICEPSITPLWNTFYSEK